MHNRRITFLFSSFAALDASGLAQDIQKLDPALDQLVDAKATVERIATGFNKLTEGPVWNHSQSLMFAEIPANSIIQWRPGQPASVFLHPSGYKGSAPFTGPEPGSNGMTLDSKGRLTRGGAMRSAMSGEWKTSIRRRKSRFLQIRLRGNL